MRIGAVFNSDLTDVHHRVVVPLRELSRRGHEVVYVQPDVSGHVAPERLVGCDVVHVHRRAEQDVVACADTLLDHGIPVTWDTDDPSAFMAADGPRFAPAPNGHRRERELRCELAMLARASVVTTTSEALAERCRTFRDHDVVVIEDYLCDEEYVFQPRAHSGVVIGWVGDPEQTVDAEWTGLTGSLRRVMERDCRVRVVTVGVRLDLDPARTTHHRHVPFERLAELIRQFDIGLAPRAELPASLARSRTTVKQYAASGVPWVASARPPYLGLGEAEGGLLVSDDGWEHALLALADARFRRRQLRRRAEEWGKAQHIAVHADQWESVFRTAASAVQQAA